jgi:hypothetical protein
MKTFYTFSVFLTSVRFKRYSGLKFKIVLNVQKYETSKTI